MDETKMRFAEALKELMRSKPLDKISVTEIASEAGLSRKAFYNHYKDKYDLLNWICYSQFVQIRADQLAGGGWHAFKAFLEFFATDRMFFAKALKDMGQNSFGQYFSDLLFEVVYETMHDGYAKAVSSEKWIGLAIATLVEDARMAIIVWLTSEDEPSVDALFNFIVACTEAFSSMICFERSLRTGEKVCGRVSETLAAWTPEPEESAVNLPAPDDPSARRPQFARILEKCR